MSDPEISISEDNVSKKGAHNYSKPKKRKKSSSSPARSATEPVNISMDSERRRRKSKKRKGGPISETLEDQVEQVTPTKSDQGLEIHNDGNSPHDSSRRKSIKKLKSKNKKPHQLEDDLDNERLEVNNDSNGSHDSSHRKSFCKSKSEDDMDNGRLEQQDNGNILHDSSHRKSFDIIKSSNKKSHLLGNDLDNEKLELKNDGNSSHEYNHRKSLGKRKSSDNKPRLLGKDFDDADFHETWCELVTKSKEKAPQITPEMSKTLAEMHIVPMHKVHFSRKFENTLLRLPTAEVKAKIESCGLNMKVGKFNLEEDEIIVANWQDFSETYGIKEPAPFLKFSSSPLPKTERKNFVLCLARGLPYRYLQAIYKRFQSLYSDLDRTGKFTAEEDKIIMLYQKHNKKNAYATLSKVLKRNKEAIYRRYVYLQSNIEKEKVDWNRDVIKSIIKSILKIKNLENLKELRDKQITSEVWREVEKECGIKRRTIQHFWDQRLSTQLFARKPVFMDKICVKLLDLLRKSNINYWQDVKWNELAHDFHGVSSGFLWNRFRQLVRNHVPQQQWEVLRDCVEYLHEHWLPSVINNTTDTEFQRLLFSDGELYDRPLKSIGLNESRP